MARALLKKHMRELIIIVFLLVVGILLLVNPTAFASWLVKAAGLFLMVLGILRIIRYFRVEAEVASKGQDFFVGIIAILGGLFCVIKTSWFLSVFPTLAVIYGLLQLVLGFSKVQRMVDFLRMKFSLWYLPAISALIYLIFGFIIVLHPEMTLMSIWVFTGVTMILEAAFNAVCIWMLEKGRLPRKEKNKKEQEPKQETPEPEQVQEDSEPKPKQESAEPEQESESQTTEP